MRYIYAITRTDAMGGVSYPAGKHHAGGIGFQIWEPIRPGENLFEALERAEHFTRKLEAARRAAFNGPESPNVNQLYRRPATGGDWELIPWDYLRAAWLPRQTWTKTASGWTLEFKLAKLTLEPWGRLGSKRYRNRRELVKWEGKTKGELMERMRNECEAAWVLPTH